LDICTVEEVQKKIPPPREGVEGLCGQPGQEAVPGSHSG
jgi:hypothetical protein